MSNSITNQDFESKIWGCHFHMDVEKKDFAKALLVQEAFTKYLNIENITYTSNSFRPGYGPHVKHSWEIRLEPNTNDSLLFQKIAKGVVWLMLNRNGLDAYVHPLTHDRANLDLLTEKDDHEKRKFKMGSAPDPELNLEFFTNPPLDSKSGRIADTRNPNMLTIQDEQELKIKAQTESGPLVLQDPAKAPFQGFHIHLDYENNQAQKSAAMKVYDLFTQFLKNKNIRHGFYLYGPGQNGPHVNGGWNVALSGNITNANLLNTVGKILGWLMLNRDGQNVFIHPVPSIRSGQAEIEAHEKYIMAFGNLPPLNLDFFNDW